MSVRQDRNADTLGNASLWPGSTPDSVPAPLVSEERVAACIVCCNEADRLGDCLQSLMWVDEILVMDLSSDDDSAAIAASYGARVIPHARYPIVEPLRNEIAAMATSDWVLVLDPDEQLSPGLPAALRAAARRADVDAVVIPRMNIDLGHAPRHPLHRYEPQLRMYRRSKVSWPTVIHKLPQVPPERTYVLPQSDDLVIIHNRHRSIAEVIERIRRYAPAQAYSMVEAGQRFTALAMFTDLGFVAYKQFVRGRAWSDGVPGVMRATIMLAHRFFVWAEFWQLLGGVRTPEDERLLRGVGGPINLGLRALYAATKLIHRLRRRSRGAPSQRQ